MNRLHRGSVDTHALCFDPALIGEAEVRRRILALWSPGASLHRLADGALLLRLPAPIRLRAEHAPGLPLIAERGSLWAFPPDPHDPLAPHPGSVVRLRAGRVQVETPGPRLDAGVWLLGERPPIREVVSLGAPPPTPRDAAPQSAATPSALLGIGAPSPERAAVLDALRKADADHDRRGGGLANLAAGALIAAAHTLGRLLPAPADTGAPPRAPSGPTALDQIRDRLARFALRTGIGAALGRQHLRYLRHMTDLFEKGAWEDALRHAIPLGQDGASGPLSLGLLRPRSDLALRPQQSGGGSSLPWGGLYDDLQQMYRNAFEKLVAAGRIEEAAFVLAELLQENEEAVAFLEKHGRATQAAEMAEARGLAPSLVVRQWWIAGDRGRAIAAARRTGAFADAVARLERAGDRDAAHALRLAWAAFLAAENDWAAAVDAAWPVEDARALVADWVERAVAAGGIAGARMLARQAFLAADDDARAAVRARLQALCDAPGEDAAARRDAFAATLVDSDAFPDRRRCAARVARALLADAHAHPLRVERSRIRQTVRLSDDHALAADLPPLPAPAKSTHASPLSLRVDAADVGEVRLRDLAPLPDGRILVALGDAGVRLLATDGHPIARFDIPADLLAVASHGNRAVVAGQRGGLWRTHRIDLAERRVRPWTDLRVAVGEDGRPLAAPTIAEAIWMVVLDDGLYALDTLADDLAFVWRMRELPGPVRALSATDGALALLMDCRDAMGPRTECWEWEMPERTLRLRRESEDGRPVPDRAALRLPLGGGTVLTVAAPKTPDALPQLWSDPEQPAAVGAPGQSPVRLLRSGPRAVTALADPDGVCVRVRAPFDWHPRAATPGPDPVHLRLDGARDVVLRIADPAALWVGDDRGRLIAVDLNTGRVLHDLRLRA